MTRQMLWSALVGVGAVREVLDGVVDEFVVAHGGATYEEVVGSFIAEGATDAVECSRSRRVDTQELADLGEGAAGKSADKDGGNVRTAGSREGVERPIEHGCELGTTALVAPDDDGFVAQFKRARVVTETSPKTAGQRHRRRTA